MNKFFWLICLYSFLSLGMDHVAVSGLEEEMPLKIFDSFGKHLLDCELMRANGLAVIDTTLYVTKTYESQLRERLAHLLFWHTTIEDIILTRQNGRVQFSNSELLKGVVKWASENHLKILLRNHTLSKEELLAGISWVVIYAGAMERTLNDFVCPSNCTASLLQCKKRLIRKYKSCLMLLKNFFVTYHLVKQKVPSDVAVHIARLALSRKTGGSHSSLKSSL